MAFWDNIHFPYFNMQELNLDWIMKELKRIAGFMPQDGNVGDILTRKSEGASWEPPEAVNININALPEDTEIGDNDQLIFYDISAQSNRKIKPPNLLDSMMSNGFPLMDGTASPGTSKKPARYDHKHPTDTTAYGGKKVKFVAGVARYENGEWSLLDGSGHAPLNMSIAAGQTNESGFTITHNIGATKVLSLVCAPDDGYSQQGVVCGASAGLDSSNVSVSWPFGAGSIVKNSGGASIYTHSPVISLGNTDIVSSVEEQLNTSLGDYLKVTFTADAAQKGIFSIHPVNGYEWKLLGATDGYVQLQAYKAGVKQTLPLPVNDAWLILQKQLYGKPSGITHTTCNIWIFGVFEVS